MPKIEDYQFGRMIISGKTYSRDLILLPDGTVLPDWFRQNGHLLLPADIEPVFRHKPDILIVGTGASGRMAIDAALPEAASAAGIRLLTEITSRAVDLYHQHTRAQKDVAACFHLTC